MFAHVAAIRKALGDGEFARFLPGNGENATDPDARRATVA
jgi:hypothetical protein